MTVPRYSKSSNSFAHFKLRRCNPRAFHSCRMIKSNGGLWVCEVNPCYGEHPKKWTWLRCSLFTKAGWSWVWPIAALKSSTTSLVLLIHAHLNAPINPNAKSQAELLPPSVCSCFQCALWDDQPTSMSSYVPSSSSSCCFGWFLLLPTTKSVLVVVTCCLSVLVVGYWLAVDGCLLVVCWCRCWLLLLLLLLMSLPVPHMHPLVIKQHSRLEICHSFPIAKAFRRKNNNDFPASYIRLPEGNSPWVTFNVINHQ